MGDLIYLYGLIPTQEVITKELPPKIAFDGIGDIYTIPIEKTTAVVCKLSSKQYTEENMKEKIHHDIDWLQEKAFHHHETVMELSKMYTVIPLKFCTLYKNEESLLQTVKSNEEKMERVFRLLKGNEEWNLKIFCDDHLLRNVVNQNNSAIEEKKEEISHLSKGKQFFEKKKLDRLIDQEMEAEKQRISELIHSQLEEFVIHGSVKWNWNKDVTGRKENMNWNSVYLISADKVEAFLEKIQKYEKEMSKMGWQFETTGPWPAYHFSSFS
ncbi:GvpL/GvpF family gas vesicle protein [Bacillus alkalisoli]|uniref:GvpL/GvpF family gas vesicle protein n=1 Tax=Bacillus alkalisoli TaxID=2011008 RepID=UPI000C23F5F3|nr:GvpL/GvpF family gas vesicle protein [Bacillus alkalisoli]